MHHLESAEIHQTERFLNCTLLIISYNCNNGFENLVVKKNSLLDHREAMAAVVIELCMDKTNDLLKQ